MSSKTNKPYGVALKIALSYAAAYMVVAAAAFGILYISLSSNLQQRLDDMLKKQSADLKRLYETGDRSLFRDEIIRQSRYEGIDRMFVIVFSRDSGVITGSDMTPWKGVPGSLISKTSAYKDGSSLFSLTAEGRSHKVRVFVIPLKDGALLAAGRTFRDNDEVMEDFRQIFSTAFSVILLIGALAAWYVAKKAMRGVERVTNTAMIIGSEGLTSRVPVGNEGREIASLATAFNEMLERIGALIEDLKSVTENIAHDLKSPLTRIRGIAETTLTGSQNIADYRDMTGNIIEECDRMVAMINTMLEIARTDAGLTRPNETYVDLNKILLDIIDIYGALSQDKGIRLVLETSETIPLILADNPMLQRAVANLVDNAVKYTSEGGVVTVSAKAVQEKIIVTVSDTGPGIPQEDIPHVFERFYRGEKSRSTPGSGLGLSLAMAVAKAHGGDLKVVSSQSGTIFHFILGLKKEKSL